MTNVAPGTYTLTAVATNDAGGSTTSAPVAIRVDAPPTASLTAPADHAILGGPTDIALAASAADTVGTVTKVDFYEGTNLLGTASTAPYSLTWPGVAPGHYTLSAVATNDAGQSATSAPIAVTVKAALATIYYIEVDQLNTPRVIEDANQNVVWRWDNQEPFGDDTPNEDPGNTGTSFSFPLRFPGQYFDSETNTAYNYYRDYDPAIGRYVQSDPVGLRGGINTYLYIHARPIGDLDASGLVDWTKLGLAAVGLGFNTVEVVGGVTAVMVSAPLGPGAAVGVPAGLLLTASGSLGMVNSTIDIGNAIYETNNPGVLQTVGKAFGGDVGAKIGSAGDLFLALRPAAIAAGGMNTIRDFVDAINGIQSLRDATTTEKNSCPAK